MRIGIDASRAFADQPTGTERYSFELVSRLIELPEAGKHTWILYTKSGMSEILNSKLKTHPNVQIIQIPNKYLWTQAGLAWRTWVDDLDVLWVPAHTLPLLRRPGLKTVVTIHGIEYEYLPAYENALQRWYLPLSTKYAAASADRLIAVSEFTKRQLVERLGARADKIRVVYEGISEIGAEGAEKGKTLGRWGLRPKQYLLFVGTVQPRKNLVRLIEAFGRLKWTGKLVIAGKLGWSFEDVLAAPKVYGVEDRVVFTRYINDAERLLLLQNAIVYVQPSITEGFGLPVIEAMRAGVPVVSSDGGALGEVVGKAGIKFDPVDVNGMTLALKAVIHSPAVRKQLAESGRRRAREFTWENSAIKTYNILVNP